MSLAGNTIISQGTKYLIEDCRISGHSQAKIYPKFILNNQSHATEYIERSLQTQQSTLQGPPPPLELLHYQDEHERNY